VALHETGMDAVGFGAVQAAVHVGFDGAGGAAGVGDGVGPATVVVDEGGGRAVEVVDFQGASEFVEGIGRGVVVGKHKPGGDVENRFGGHAAHGGAHEGALQSVDHFVFGRVGRTLADDGGESAGGGVEGAVDEGFKKVAGGFSPYVARKKGEIAFIFRCLENRISRVPNFGSGKG